MLTLFNKLLILPLVLILTGLAYGNPNIAVVQQNVPTLDLAPYISYLEDPTKQLTLADVQSAEFASRFQPVKGEFFVAEQIHSPYWFKFTLQAPAQLSDVDSEYVVYFSCHQNLLYKLFFYQPIDGSSSNSSYQETRWGKLYMALNSSFDSPHYNFPIKLKAGVKSTFYFMADSTAVGLPISIPVYLQKKAYYQHENFKLVKILTGFYAIFSAFFIYNLCLFISIRASVYFYYNILLFLSMAVSGSVDATFLKLFWPDNPLWDIHWASITPSFLCFIYLMFIWASLEIPKKLPHFKSFYYMGFAITLLTFVFILPRHDVTDFVLNGRVTQVVAAFTTLFNLTVIIVAIRAKISIAKYLLIAELSYIIGSSIFMSAMNNFLPFNTFTQWSLHLGFLLEIIFLSFAIADRTNEARQEKLEAEKLAFANSRKALEAEAQSKARSQFFAAMSHEIRTPLTAIIGYSESLGLKNYSAEEKEEFSSIIYRSGQHLLQIINDILDISKIEVDKIQVEQLSVPLFDLLTEIKSYFVLNAKGKGINFTLNYRFPLPRIIRTDPTRLKQILINLCGNAIKFTEKGGVALIVDYEPGTDALVFIVKDSGIGLSVEQISHLFNAFQQAEAATTRNYGGTGLGLYLAKMLAQKLGGDISVSSQIGLGSEFNVSIKANADQQTMTHQMPQLDYVSLAQNPQVPTLIGKVLYAEDNIENQKLIARLITETGAEVTVVNNGKEAIDAVMTESYDLILMDIRMPVLGGVEATQQVLTINNKLPVVAITANVASSDREQYKQAGFVDFIEKPVQRDQLYRVLMNYLAPQVTALLTVEQQTIEKHYHDVLLVEDNIDNRKLAQLQLSRLNLNVDTAIDGADAVAKCLSKQYELVFMDLQMPVMDGYSAVLALREKGCRLPIYALTADADQDILEKCLSSGFNGTLMKPMNMDEIRSVIRKI